jgi:hypothetical protein
MRTTLTVAATVLVLAVSGCAPSRPAAAAPAPRTYADLAELTAATMARFRQDRTVRSTGTLRVVTGGSLVRTRSGESEVRLDPDGPAVHIHQLEKLADARPTDVELTILPQEAYLRPDRAQWPAPNPPWIRIDPAGADPVSRSIAPFVTLNRTTGTRLFCFTELGNAALTGSAPDQLDGVPTQRFVLHVELTPDAADAASAKELRDLGVTAIDAAAYVDAQDRVIGCRFSAAVPGGTVEGDERFTAFGDPVAIAAPPADQVVHLPSGS